MWWTTSILDPKMEYIFFFQPKSNVHPRVRSVPTRWYFLTLLIRGMFWDRLIQIDLPFEKSGESNVKLYWSEKYFVTDLSKSTYPLRNLEKAMYPSIFDSIWWVCELLSIQMQKSECNHPSYQSYFLFQRWKVKLSSSPFTTQMVKG
jgi:hypothetical protein